MPIEMNRDISVKITFPSNYFIYYLIFFHQRILILRRYIANQARRKMLVHTAVPMQQDEIETYNAGEAIEELYELLDEIENPPKIKSPSKTISNKLLTKSSEQRVLNKHASKGKPPSEKVPRRSFASQKKLVVSSNEINSSYDDPMDISNNIDDISTFVNTSNTPITVSVSNADARPTLPKILRVETVKLVQIQPTTPTTKIEPSETKIEKDSKLTEFIFMGEMYVQMPKSEYMAEKEKYMEKVDYYKNLLQELEAKIQNALKS